VVYTAVAGDVEKAMVRFRIAKRSESFMMVQHAMHGLVLQVGGEF
jgi:hypothetical protein